MRTLAQLERPANNHELADALDSNNFLVIDKVSKKNTLYIKDFLMMRARSFVKEVAKETLGIAHHQGRVEFAPGRG